MIHTMPDKTIRVTSRFPQGQNTIYFDLKYADGFTLEEDILRPETFILKMLGCYTSSSAHYGGIVEAEADFSDLNLMLADRHSIAAPSPAPSPAPLTATPDVRRKGWGWKGAVAGVALGAVGAYFVTDMHAANVVARSSFRASSNDSIPYGLVAPSGPTTGPSASVGPSTVQQPAAAPLIPATPPRPQLQPPPQARAPAPTASFGLQP